MPCEPITIRSASESVKLRCPLAAIRASLARQLREPHQELVDGTGALPALANRPDDQRLAAPHVAGGENLWHRRYVSARALRLRPGIAPGVLLHAEFLQQRMHRRDETHRQQNEIGGHVEFRARD